MNAHCRGHLRSEPNVTAGNGHSDDHPRVDGGSLKSGKAAVKRRPDPRIQSNEHERAQSIRGLGEELPKPGSIASTGARSHQRLIHSWTDPGKAACRRKMRKPLQFAEWNGEKAVHGWMEKHSRKRRETSETFKSFKPFTS